MFSFTYVWPYMGLGAALLLALLLCTNALRSDLTVSRWQDLVWLAWAGSRDAGRLQCRPVDGALVLFAPLSLWAFHVALSRYRLGWRAVIATIAAGIVFHAIMIGSLPVFLAGGIGVFVLDAIQVINPILILLIVAYFGRRPATPAP